MPEAPRQRGAGGARRPRTAQERASGAAAAAQPAPRRPRGRRRGRGRGPRRGDRGEPRRRRRARVGAGRRRQRRGQGPRGDRAASSGSGRRSSPRSRSSSTRTDQPGFRVAATRAELGARPRVKAAVDEALEPRNIGGRILSGIGIAPTRDVEILWTFDAKKLAGLIRQVTGRTNDPARSASLEVTESTTSCCGRRRAATGSTPRALRREIAAGETEVAVTPGPLTPAVSDEAAAAAREQALAPGRPAGAGDVQGQRRADRAGGAPRGAALPRGPAGAARRPRPGRRSTPTSRRPSPPASSRTGTPASR